VCPCWPACERHWRRGVGEGNRARPGGPPAARPAARPPAMQPATGRHSKGRLLPRAGSMDTAFRRSPYIAAHRHIGRRLWRSAEMSEIELGI